MKKQKAASKDLGFDELPHNRVQVFFDRIKTRWSLLLLVGLILAFSSLPALLVLFLKDASLASLASDYQAGKSDLAAYQAAARSNANIYALCLIPCLVIFSIPLAGAMRVIRQLSWGEGIFFGEDFKDGIKQNGLPYAFVFLGISLFYVLDSFIFNAGFGYPVLQALPYGFSVAFFLPIALIFLNHVAVYKAPAGQALKNATILFLNKIFGSYLGAIAFLAPFLFLLIPSVIGQVIALFLSALCYLPLALLGWMLYCHFIFDRSINQSNCPELVDRGVYRLSKKG
jgi:hypothetical protein